MTETVSPTDRGPLSGVRVLDLTRVISGPYATMMLADMGADIVKVEEPEQGDEMRWIRYQGRGVHDEDYFNTINRSKRSITLNLKNPDDRGIARELAKKADVLVENFSPGVADRLGMGWNDLRPSCPRLIYCSISGFGQTGPYRSRPALDPIIQALSGVMSVTGHADGEPLKIGAPVADVITGMFGAYAIAAALAGVKAGGKGRYLDVSMLDSMIAVLGPRMGESLQAGIDPGRHGNGTAMRVPADTYVTSDNRFLVMMVLNDAVWGPFCEAMEKPDWLANPAYRTRAGRVACKEVLNAAVAERFRSRTGAEWAERLEKYRVPFGFVNNYLEAVEDPQVRHRGLIKSLRHPLSGEIRVVGAPWKTPDSELDITAPPVLGEHTADVLTDWLSMDAAEAKRIQEAQARLRR